MGEIIAVANLKGGVGKSTIAVNLACALRGADRSAVVIDADSQGTSLFWSQQGSLPVETRAMPLEDDVHRSGWISRLMGRNGLPNGGRTSDDWIAEVRRIAADYVVIDCPPHVGTATRAAVWTADLVVVPVTAAAVDLAATRPALDLISRAREARADGGPKCLVVPSRVDRSTATGRTIKDILKHLGEPVGPSIGQRIAFADAVAFGQWIGDYAPQSAAHEEMLNLAYCVRRLISKQERRRGVALAVQQPAEKA